MTQTQTWAAGTPGLMPLPSGRLIRGRGLGLPRPAGQEPAFAVYLRSHQPPDMPWPFRWVAWPDFRLPADTADARAALREAWERTAAERVEVACFGGNGRTGTALACIAILDGVPAMDAVSYVREHYRRRAVETPGQRRFVRGFR